MAVEAERGGPLGDGAGPSGEYEVIVVGAGHAGCEAALASARIGCRTLLITLNLDTIATMPCNPSVGGPGKAHLVREVDALGGEMARNTDRTFIQIRMLNVSKGPAVQALRAQVDKRLYSLSMKHRIEWAPRLQLKQGHVERVLVEGDCVAGVQLTSGERFAARAVVLTAGTFLNGRVLRGEYATSAGRAGEFPSRGLARSLRELGFELGRLQTNTPPRLDARTIDYTLTQPQYGSDEPLYFSFDGPPDEIYRLPIRPEYPIGRQTQWRCQMPCYLVHTNSETHRVIRDNLHRSPIVAGATEAAGPRYCPSIEDKIVRFGDREAHQFFLEPEGYATGEVYVQGCFTALPYEVQAELLHTIPALRRAEMVRPGYAIEYDYVPAHQLRSTLETRLVRGLFHAGQINGTSGYEEAAAQGLLAGANAALLVRDRAPLQVGRDEAYLGVLVDDLVTKDHREPYRIMTSRAEYRLLLRQDNADERLAEIGRRTGLIEEERYQRIRARCQAVAQEIDRLKTVMLRPSEELRRYLEERGLQPVDRPISAYQFLKRPGTDYEAVRRYVPAGTEVPDDVAHRAALEIRYEGYIAKQQRQVARARRLESRRIPSDLDYDSVPGLGNESRERLASRRPETLGQASRIAGVNPTDVSVLMIYLARHGGKVAGDGQGGSGPDWGRGPGRAERTEGRPGCSLMKRRS